MSRPVETPAYDMVLVGGGLANGLIACRLRERRPDLKLLVLEAGAAAGGAHTWSFHEGDLSPAQARWMEPFVVHRWPRYDVRFPRRARTVATGYRSVTSERFAAVVTERLGASLRTGVTVAGVEAQAVTLADGSRIAASSVIDGRGAGPSRHLTLGFQKFLGQEIAFAEPHGVARPIVMDATVAQGDGYRFVYVLPFGPRTLLVEDTYYADGPALDPARLRASVADYVARAGWGEGQVLREEQGVLPIALGGDIERFWAEKNGVPASGLAAALFHPTTGYSLPDAVRLADRIAALPDFAAPAVFAACRGQSVDMWRARGFFRLLDRLLFLAGDASRRYEILQHFYRLPDPLVARFYAGTLRPLDKARILTGRPPVSVTSALRVLLASPHPHPHPERP